MSRRVEVIERELADAKALLEEIGDATVPDSSLGPKGVKSKYPPGIIANVRQKVKLLQNELVEARKTETIDHQFARSVRNVTTKKK